VLEIKVSIARDSCDVCNLGKEYAAMGYEIVNEVVRMIGD